MPSSNILWASNTTAYLEAHTHIFNQYFTSGSFFVVLVVQYVGSTKIRFMGVLKKSRCQEREKTTQQQS